MMIRDRSLSDEGHKMLNVALKPKRKQLSRSYIKNLLMNLLTTNYDLKVFESTKNFRNSSNVICSYLDSIDNPKIPILINNAINNLILLILLYNVKIESRRQAK